MKSGLVAALLLLAASFGQAQTDGPSASQPAASVSPGAESAAAFTIGIDAPDEIRLVLERHLELQRYRQLADLSDDEIDRLIESAHGNALELVATLGYFSPEIRIARDNAADGSRRIHIQVRAGEPVRIAQVQLHFAGAIASDPQAAAQRQAIQDSWSLPVGNRFSQLEWDAAKQQALRLLTSQRYPAGHISDSQADIDPAAHGAVLDLTLDSGPAYRLGAFNVSGLQRYDADLVQRLARLPEGAAYDQAMLVAAQQRLTDSGFFESAYIGLDTGANPDAAPLQLTLREAKLQRASFGIGASTDSGARLSVEHLHHKLPGLGWRALSKLSVDRITQSIGTELTAPPDSNGWRWTTSALFQTQLSSGREVGSQRLRGGASRAGDTIDRSYYLQYDRADSAATDLAPPELAESLSANYAFTLRRFDSLPFPNAGWGLGLEIGAGTTLGAERVPYSRVMARWHGIWPLGRSDTGAATLRAGRLALRAQLGAVVAKEDVTLPVTQLFLAGGDNSVRGYALDGIGVPLAGGQTSAGRYLSVGSVEWQRPILQQGRLTDWESTLFIDAGAVADKPSELRARVGVGAGARWKSPVGPLQIDLAYGVDVHKFRLHLNLGFTF